MNFSMDNRIAKIVGADAAIVLHNILFWVKTNNANRKNFHDGKTWTYNSTKAFSEIFDWLTERQIRTCLEKLEKEGLVETGVFNKLGYDRTKWYTVTQKAYDILREPNCQNSKFELTKMSNGKDKNVEPIPDINTDINTDIKTNNNKPLKIISVTDTVSKPKNKVEKPDSVSQEVWDDYLILRKQKRAPVTNTVLKGLEREACKAGLSLEKVMQLCVERGWQGFNASWVCDEKKHRIASDNMQGDDYKKYCTFIGGEE